MISYSCDILNHTHLNFLDRIVIQMMDTVTSRPSTFTDPTCLTAHVAADLQRHRNSYVYNQNSEISQIWKDQETRLQSIYDSTPAGILSLEHLVYRGSKKKHYEESTLERYTSRLHKAQQGKGFIPEDVDCSCPLQEQELTGHTKLNSEEDSFIMMDVFPPRASYNALQNELLLDSEHYTASLTPEEIQAISWFTADGYHYVNNHLAQVEGDGEFSHGDESYLSTAYKEDIIQHLTSALQKAQRQNTVRVFRGIKGSVMLHALGYAIDDYKKLNPTTLEQYVKEFFVPGEEWVSPTFMSSTLSYKRAYDFGYKLVLEIEAKTAASVTAISSWGSSELELILPKDVAYSVENVFEADPDHFSGKKYIVQMREL